jgi:hypothetical protein
VQKPGEGNAPTPAFAFDAMTNWIETDFRAARMAVEGLDRHLAQAGPPERNPFKASRLLDFAPSQRPAFSATPKSALSETEALRSRATELAASMGLEVPAALEDVGLVCRAARRAEEAPNLQGLQLASDDWIASSDDLAHLTAAGRKLSELHAEYDDWLIDDAWSQDLLEVRQHYANLGGKWWRFLSGNFRRAKARLGALCRKPLPRGQGEAMKLIDAVMDGRKHRSVYDELTGLGESLFGSQWKRETSDWDVLEQRTEWVAALRRDIGDGGLPAGILDFLSDSREGLSLKENLDDTQASLERQQASLSAVVSSLQFEQEDAGRFRTAITLESQVTMLGHQALRPCAARVSPRRVQSSRPPAVPAQPCPFGAEALACAAQPQRGR